MAFLMTIVIILHLNIDLCSGTSKKHFVINAKAKNASLMRHADRGTKAKGSHRPKKSKSETGRDYQQSMATDAASPDGDRTMDDTVYYCRQCGHTLSDTETQLPTVTF